MGKPEEHRSKWAFGLTIVFSVLIFTSFLFYKGYVTFGNNVVSNTQVANVVSAGPIISPIESTKETFKAAFAEIGKQYQQLKDSMSAVFVPFITGIDVYQRK